MYHVPLPTKHHLLQLRADFLPVSLLQKSIAVWFLCAFPHQHPSPLGSCLLSFLVHHQWAKRLEKQICWLEVHWFKFRVWWWYKGACYKNMTKRGKWPFGRSFQQNGPLSAFQCCPSRAITQTSAVGAGTEMGTWTAARFRWKLVLRSHDFIIKSLQSSTFCS